MKSKEEISEWFRGLQNRICKGLEELDGKARFAEDKWNREAGLPAHSYSTGLRAVSAEAGGGGITRVIANGSIFEKGGVNFSEVFGTAPEFLKKESGANGEGHFYATGVSIVIHPESPMVPIIHMNVRYFEMDGHTKWFGGGIDLTPAYVNSEDARFFHKRLKQTCDRFDAEYYQRFKAWADDYFFIPHRNETRGIGGIFFDRLKPDERVTVDRLFEFVAAVGDNFLPIYSELVKRNRRLIANDSTQKQWHALRRGRYAEFNLVYDKGTRFGLETNGRTESILMSLPPTASWVYDFKPKQKSEEEKTLNLLKKGIDWA